MSKSFFWISDIEEKVDREFRDPDTLPEGLFDVACEREAINSCQKEIRQENKKHYKLLKSL